MLSRTAKSSCSGWPDYTRRAENTARMLDISDQADVLLPPSRRAGRHARLARACCRSAELTAATHAQHGG